MVQSHLLRPYRILSYNMNKNYTLHNGDCLEVLKTMNDNSVDSIVTDPPYGLSFMGKKWDYDVPSQEIWEECLRVLKPGGHLLAFAGTRTQHRMAVRIEDAGFEIRDMIAWVYGSGFPKSQNVSKAIDKAAGATRNVRKVIKPGHEDFANRKTKGHITDGNEGWKRPWMEKDSAEDYPYEFEPATEEAKQWDGWGTALKPALEPITVARKPLEEKTIAANVLKHGTGAINIDESRVAHVTVGDGSNLALNSHLRVKINGGNGGNIISTETERRVVVPNTQGRFPANFIHDGSDEVTELFPNSKSCSSPSNATPKGTIFGGASTQGAIYPGEDDTAARFFYCAKTSKKDRNEGLELFEAKAIADKKGNGIRRVCSTCGVSMMESHLCECEVKDWQPPKKLNSHPTVKPTDLMRYLVRMVTPKDGTVLDPFMGSGSTGKGAMLEGIRFIGIEIDPDYMEIAETRIKFADTNDEDKATLEDFFV